MTYEEFTTLAQRRISIDEYKKTVEPVYNYHPAIPDKETAAKLYDLCGLQVFRDMRETADRVAWFGKEKSRIRGEMDALRVKTDEINNILRDMATATPIADVESEAADG